MRFEGLGDSCSGLPSEDVRQRIPLSPSLALRKLPSVMKARRILPGNVSRLVMGIAIGLATADGEDWPNWRGPRFDGVSPESVPAALPGSLPVAWRAKVGTGFSSFAVVGDCVLTMGNANDRDTVWCFDVDTGEVRWKHSYACELDPLYYEGGPGATPTVHEGVVYTLSKKGHAFRLDLETGTVEWARDLVADHGFELPEWSFAGSPFIEGDRVILNVGRGGIALDLATGATVWKGSEETSGYATAVPFGAETHLLFSAKSLLGLDPQEGKIRWEFPWKCSRDVNAADPIVIGQNRFVLSNSNGTVLVAAPEESGGEPEVIWENKDLKWYFNPGVRIGEHLYSLHGTTHRPTELTCTEVATGKTVWAEEGFGSGGLVAAGRTVVLFDLGVLTLFEASPEGFEPRFRQKLLDGKCWTAPVIANGRIYVRNAAGEIACVSLPD